MCFVAPGRVRCLPARQPTHLVSSTFSPAARLAALTAPEKPEAAARALAFALKNPIRNVKRKALPITAAKGAPRQGGSPTPSADGDRRPASPPLALPAPTETPHARLGQLHALLTALRAQSEADEQGHGSQ